MTFTQLLSNLSSFNNTTYKKPLQHLLKIYSIINHHNPQIPITALPHYPLHGIPFDKATLHWEKKRIWCKRSWIRGHKIRQVREIRGICLLGRLQNIEMFYSGGLGKFSLCAYSIEWLMDYSQLRNQVIWELGGKMVVVED